MPSEIDDVASAARAAIVDRNWLTLRPLLHPYLHWTQDDGHKVRGRTAVLAMLERLETPPEPATVELRDGQIYHWVSRPQS
jgi:hypothetical protein